MKIWWSFLIEKGADVNVAGANGVTPLMIAADAGDEELAEMLVDKGANVNASASGGWTSLILACETGNPDAVDFAVRKGRQDRVQGP